MITNAPAATEGHNSRCEDNKLAKGETLLQGNCLTQRITGRRARRSASELGYEVDADQAASFFMKAGSGLDKFSDKDLDEASIRLIGTSFNPPYSGASDAASNTQDPGRKAAVL